VLVAEFIDLSLQFVRLLLFNGLDIALSDALDLSEATMREPVASQFDLFQGCVFVETF